GPPIGWERMCGPMRGAVIGACIYEGWARDESEAVAMAESGALDFEACHHYNAVGPMAGITSPSMPVFVIEDKTHGNRTYSTLNEGLGKVLRFGAFGPEVIERLRWMQEVLGPALGRAIRALGGIDVRAIISQALQMGDECHSRNKAATSLFVRQVGAALVETGSSREETASVLRFIGGSPADALRYTREMYDITVASNPLFGIPSLDFQGVPTGIDVRQVCRLNMLPVINTGIAHRLPGVGQVGAGVVYPPMECFEK